MNERSSIAPGRSDSSALPNVSILIVTYNSRALIGRCLEAIAQAALTTTYEILLIDNGEDGSGEFVARHYPQVRIIPSQGNVGFARGNNILAMSARARLLLLLNPDLFAAPGAIDELRNAAERYPEAGAWGGLTLNQAGEPDASSNALGRPTLVQFVSAATGKSIAARAPLDLERDSQAEVVCGGFVVINREAWDKVGGFDERFFLYCEEVDLFWRMRQLGYPIYRIPLARGEHFAAHGNPLAPNRCLYLVSGKMEYVRKHWPVYTRYVAAGLIWVAAMERYLAGKLAGRRRPQLAALGEAYRLIATRPHWWINGYDPDKGLMVRRPSGLPKNNRFAGVDRAASD